MGSLCLDALLGVMGPLCRGDGPQARDPKGCWASRLAARWSSVTAPVGGGLCPALGTDGPGAL